MNWRYYILGDAPRGTLTPTQRKEAWRRAYSAPGALWRNVGLIVIPPAGPFVIGLLLVVVPVPEVSPGAAPAVMDYLLEFGQTIALSLLAAVMLFMAVGSFVYIRIAWRGPFYTALQSLGIEHCHKCGYSLSQIGEESTACPECGAGRKECVCLHCGEQLATYHGGELKCPHCHKMLTDPIRPVRHGVAWVPRPLDSRLRKSMSRRERWRLWRQCWSARTPIQRVRHAIGILLTMATMITLIGGLIAGRIGKYDWYLATVSDWAFGAGIVAILTVVALIAWAAFRGNASFVRRTARKFGHNICLTCGCWLEVEPAELGCCPVCETPREPAPGGEG